MGGHYLLVKTLVERETYIDNIYHVYIFWYSKEHPGCVSWIDSTLSSMRNISVHLILIKRNKRKRNKKYSVYNFSKHVQHCETFRQHKLNPSWNEASKLLNFWNYLSHKIVTHASHTNSQKLTTFNLLLLEKWNSSSPQWATWSKLIQCFYTINYKTGVFSPMVLWFAVILVYRNVQVATVRMGCILLRQGIWV